MKALIIDKDRRQLERTEAMLQEINPDAEIILYERGQDAAVYAATGTPDVVITDTDLPDIDGINLVRILQGFHPHINVIFVTEEAELAAQAFTIHASGFIVKPLTIQRLTEELENLRYESDFLPRTVREDKRPASDIFIRTFGNFEAFCNGSPIPFQHTKTLELLAYLVDRNGAMCSNKEIVSTLWEDDPPQVHVSYFRNLRKDLIETLTGLGAQDIIVRKWGGIGICPQMIRCDYYDYLAAARGGGAASARRVDLYRGEYMLQFSWAEETNSVLSMMQENWGRGA